MPRQPKPTSLRVLEGNRGKRPLRNEPKPPPLSPEPPDWLDAEARAEWERVIPLLDEIGVLARLDRSSLAAYCSLWSKYVEAETLVTDDWRHAVTTARLRDQLRMFIAEFGMSPVARARLAVPQRKDDRPGWMAASE